MRVTYQQMDEIAHRIANLRRENAIAYIKSTQHLTGLPASGYAFHLAHNWMLNNGHNRETMHAFRHIKYLEGKLWDADRVKDRWYARRSAETFNATGQGYYDTYLAIFAKVA